MGTPTRLPTLCRGPWVTFMLIILGSHLWAFHVFGAVFWIDSFEAYLELSEGFSSQAAFRAAYCDNIFSSHVGPGYPFFLSLFQSIPPAYQWPAIAGVQHALAGVALLWCFTELYRAFPSRLHYFTCAALSLVPFYQAFHSSLMTESLSSSLLLLGTAWCLRFIRRGHICHWGLACLFGCALAASLIRVYFALFFAGLFAAVLVWNNQLFSRYAVGNVLALVSCVLAFPAVRWLVTGEWFLNSIGIWAVIVGCDLNLNPGPAYREAWGLYDLPGTLTPDVLAREGVSIDRMYEIANYWKQQGCPPAEIRRRGEHLGSLLRDQHDETLARRSLNGLVCCGLPSALCLYPADRPFRQGLTAAENWAHCLRHYRWLSWVAVDNYGSHLDLFQQIKAKHFDLSRHFPLVRPYLSDGPATSRDPVRLSRVPPDVWALGGLLAGGFLLYRRSYLGLVIVGSFLVHFAVAFAVGVGDPRYSYALLPLWFLGASAALSQVKAGWQSLVRRAAPSSALPFPVGPPCRLPRGGGGGEAGRTTVAGDSEGSALGAA